MNCRRVQRSLSAYCDGRLSEQERQGISSHLTMCRDCASQSEQLLQLRAGLRAMPRLSPPRHLATALRVLASHERARQSARDGLPAFLAHYTFRARLWLKEMMRPVALPVAGGVLSAVVLFAILVPTFAPGGGPDANDVPIPLSTEATFVSLGPFTLSEDDIVLDLTVDRQGRVIDYSTPSGQRWVNNVRTRRSVENALLFTVFNPGTTFGRPAFGKVRVTLRRSTIEVKG
jgi:hypothetical protein